MILLMLIAFLLELIAFFAFAGLALILGLNPIIQIVVYVLILSLLIAFWSRFMSPRAPNKLTVRKYYVSKAVIYFIAAFALFNIINPTVSLIFIVVWLTDETLIYTLRSNEKQKVPVDNK